MNTTLQRVQLRHLHCFLAVARSGNLRGAAQALAVSQPAVTKTLAELEDILGVRLFERGRRGAEPTAAARALWPHASAVVAGLAEALQSVGGAAEHEHLVLGALPTLAPSFVPAVVQALADAAAPGRPHPASGGPRLQVLTDRNPTLLERLRAGGLDAAIGRLAEPDQMVGLSFEHLYAEPLVAVVRPGHPLLRRGTAPPGDLGGHLLALPLPGTLIRHSADSLLAQLGVGPPVRQVETLSASLGTELAVRAGAVWLTPLGAAEPALQDGRLTRLPWPPGATDEPVGLLLRTDAAPRPALQRLIGAIREQAAQRRAALAAALAATGSG